MTSGRTHTAHIHTPLASCLVKKLLKESQVEDENSIKSKLNCSSRNDFVAYVSTNRLVLNLRKWLG